MRARGDHRSACAAHDLGIEKEVAAGVAVVDELNGEDVGPYLQVAKKARDIDGFEVDGCAVGVIAGSIKVPGRVGLGIWRGDLDSVQVSYKAVVVTDVERKGVKGIDSRLVRNVEGEASVDADRAGGHGGVDQASIVGRGVVVSDSVAVPPPGTSKGADGSSFTDN